MLTAETPSAGDFVQVRQRHWLVEGVDLADREAGCPPRVSLACIDDDAQGEPLQVHWDAELNPEILPPDDWASIGADGTDDARTFAAYLRTARWSAATSVDPTLFQAPYRAGIRVAPYQLEPLRKALQLPRVNLLIADDVGLGKTIEAGLIVRELLLRRRIDYLVVASPPSMTVQWREEMESKFGLTLRPVDRESVTALRRQRGYVVNPWTTDSRFVISHKLLIDETYASGLRDALGAFRPRSLLILDEAHHAAPSSSARYAIDSQFTKAVREIAPLFEHRLFLTATPHNGHENSFAALMEMLDPQRFTRGVAIENGERDLRPVMVRRLKEDLRKLREPFPERRVEPIVLDDVAADAPELVLAERLAAYQDRRERRIGGMRPREAAQARLVFAGLQTRLLSSINAFAKTLKRHRDSLARALDGSQAAAAVAVAVNALAVRGFAADEAAESEQGVLEDILDAEAGALDWLTQASAREAESDAIRSELADVDDMLRIAEAARYAPDARLRWLIAWIGETMRPGGAWNGRRLLLFTEWEDTRVWVEAQLRHSFDDDAKVRIGVISGPTGSDEREGLKRAFNADPEVEPLRILICTDAAREGINLQQRCDTLIHIDLPWNPSRLEQRNGRIDRMLQASPVIWCRYFYYPARPEDRVLQALVRKTEVIRRQLGSAGKVLADGLAETMEHRGIVRSDVERLSGEIRDATDDLRQQRARQQLDGDQARREAALAREMDELRRLEERARRTVGVEAEDLRRVVEAAVTLARRTAGADDYFVLPPGESTEPLTVPAYALSPDDPAFAGNAAWMEAFDALRTRPPDRGEPLASWRSKAPIRSITFQPPITVDGRDETGVVQVHLEHRLVRRLLSRFQAIGFQHELARACVIESAGRQPRVVLLARLSLFGPSAARLHEEIVPVTAIWTEPAGRSGPLAPLGDRGEETTLDQLETALGEVSTPDQRIVERLLENLPADVDDLKDALVERAEAIADQRTAELGELGAREAEALRRLLTDQLQRIDRRLDVSQQAFDFSEAERRQKRDDESHMTRRRLALREELMSAPDAVAGGYAVQARRIEPLGVVYLWPRRG
ncbi:MAG TPA: DISARM system SNF2-like helicase DrmD [Caulobacteraceae bacterium]|jgi:SNF2 family DNA or RNA helicase|nr:DISARM system SNF2-like helicase DrmD [Caulobacteraceae bacterium]